MHHRWPLIFTIVAVAIVASRGEHKQRKLHRLVGGHLKIVNPESDDTELILTASAGDPKDKKPNGKNHDEDKKTLSQQVAEGKYGLIQKELFKKPPKRPGILSYEANPEVPKDNINTLGGLSKNEIWLAENHLLVIRGGTYPPHDDTKDYIGSIWQPIDDYSAPLHQVKIPKNPKVPPPFPVQFTDDGPLQILGTNFTRTLNDSAEAEAYALPPPGLGWEDEEDAGYETTQSAIGTDPTNPPAWQTPVRVPSKSGQQQARPPGEYNGGLPLPPSLISNGTWPAFFESLPPGAVIITPPPPQQNGTEVPIDEDDPSIYYPPPYSFFYPKDNSSAVPPGPLVPGLVLPPPPNFFAPLEETTTQPPTTITTIITTTTTTEKQKQYKNVLGVNDIRNALKSNSLTTKRPKYSTVSSVRFVETRRNRTRGRTPYRGTPMTTLSSTTKKPKVEIISSINIGTNAINRTYLPQKTVKPTKLKPTVTILRPVKPISSTPKVVVYNNAEDNSQNQYEYHPKKSLEKYGPPEQHQNLPINNEVYEQPVSLKPVISTTRVPLKYYSSVEANSATDSPKDSAIDINSNIPKTTPKSPTQYYFFEEEPEKSRITTKKPQVITSSYFESQQPYYSRVPATEKPVAYYSSIQSTEEPRVYYPSRQTTENPAPYYPQTTSGPQYVYVNSRPTPKPRFRLVPQPPRLNTFSIHIAKLKNELQQYYTTPKVVTRHKVNPVYQYSFEANNIKRPNSNFKPSPQIHVPPEHFKPIPYSVEIQPAVEVTPSSTTELTNYFSTPKPNYYNRYPEQQNGFVITSSKPILEYSYDSTPNPVHQGFYTKPDEGYFDENTRNYFTMFGRKLPGSTTTLPPRQKTKVLVQKSKPISLENDINVNYANPRPTIEPHSENYHKPEIVKAVEWHPRLNSNFRYNQPPDVVKAVEYRPAIHQEQQRDGSYISYELPGDSGAHFYFLTPQLATQKNQVFYEQTNNRVRRKPTES